jgi:hypothetical protein
MLGRVEAGCARRARLARFRRVARGDAVVVVVVTDARAAP